MKNMKVLLMMPPMSIKSNYVNLENAAANMPSIGLASVYSAFEESGCDVHFRDFQGQTTSVEEILDYIEQQSFDMVGMQTYISNINICFEISELIKKRLPGTKIILGGTHATIFADKVINHPSVDYVFLGEAELTITELVTKLKKHQSTQKILGLYYKNKDGKIFKNERRPLVHNLDYLPKPKYDIFDQEKYFPGAHIRGEKVLNIITARGCPFSCTFCAATRVFGSSFRYHSIDRVIDEMKSLKHEYHADALQIYDDNFTTNKPRVKELCQRMIDEKLNFEWVCYTRADCLDDKDMLRLMKEAGCYMIVVGIESSTERILKFINKRLNLEKAVAGVRLANEMGFNVLSSFMIGLPTQTKKDINDTIKFSKKIGLTYATFPIFTPYPGTPIYEDAQRFGVLSTQNFDKYSRWGDGIYSSEGLTPKDYRWLQKKAFLHFYFRPRILFKLFIEIMRLPNNRRIRFIKGAFSFIYR